MNIRRMMAAWHEPGPTAVLEHGANPGLISHWTKQGLIDMAERLPRRPEGLRPRTPMKSGNSSSDQTFNRLAMKLGVKVIHCSERDTQITDRPKEVGEFVNTWSIEGFREEGITTAEMGWGTHEKQLPPLAYHHANGPGNQICLARMGINTWVVSWVPYYCIRGMIIRHGEAFTISDRLTVWEDGRPIYRPTVHYAYCPCDAAIVSLEELRGRDYELQPKLRDHGRRDHQSGGDILGALLMGHAYQCWWTGSVLSIEESRRLVPAPKRHYHAGGDFRGGGRLVDGRESPPRRVRAGRSAARVHPRHRPALSRPVAVSPLRLDAAEVLPEQLPRLQPAGRRFRRPVAIQELLWSPTATDACSYCRAIRIDSSASRKTGPVRSEFPSGLRFPVEFGGN